ncbi:MAG: hypothetical protein OXG37_16095 [Actinomycetia bacterium]|nr:hypothetical protein [Actinomycetes bacterium]
MKKRQRQAVVAELSKQMAASDSWCGETHLQKSVFVLQEVLLVPTGFNYTLYKYGPFSRDLRAELSGMRADGFLDVVVQSPPYGPRLLISDASKEQLLRRWQKTLSLYKPQIEFVVERLGSKMGVEALERLTTALWMRSRQSESSELEQAERISEAKPHVSIEQALEAIGEAKQLEAEALQAASSA